MYSQLRGCIEEGNKTIILVHHLNKLGEIDNISAIESTFVMSEIKQNYGINI